MSSSRAGSRTNTNKRPPSSKDNNSRPGTAKKSSSDLLSKEEEYLRLNAELEARTATLVQEAEEVLRGQDSLLSRVSTIDLDDDLENYGRETSPDPVHMSIEPQEEPVVRPKVRPTSNLAKQRNKSRASRPRSKAELAAEDVAVPDEVSDFSLTETITKLEGEVESGRTLADMDDVLPSAAQEMGAEAQIRFLKAKLRVMQEEVDRLGHECTKRGDENSTLVTRIKDLEEERGRLTRTTQTQQSQMEKFKKLSEDAKKKSDGLEQQLAALRKELETLKRQQKQADTNHSATEVRLNRALEEAEKYKLQLQKAKSSSKMHVEAAKMLSFTEEEFVKALEWGN
ncbi:Golgin sub A member 2 [Branchiostoma belcheri]|nr:Golgin sub A member 2 [Branchiostoma belcheri]